MAWVDLCSPPHALRLAPTLLSGMSFRWRYREESDSFFGVLGRTVYELQQHAATAKFRTLPARATREDERRLRSHLSLDRGCDSRRWLARPADVPAPFLRAAAALPGVRVLSIAPLEALVAFMGSANNNIKRNMQMVDSLCAEFEENWICDDEHGTKHYAFPSVEQLMRLSEERLWAIGWGYRAPRLYKLVRQLHERGAQFLEHLSTKEEEARAQLCELCGVGRKVADCVLLFAYGHDGCVPVDTHCFQMAQRFLLPAARGKSLTAPLYAQIVQRFHDIFGAEFAGWAFMTLFVGELSDFRRLLVPISNDCGDAQLKDEEIALTYSSTSHAQVGTVSVSKYWIETENVPGTPALASSPPSSPAAVTPETPPTPRVRKSSRNGISSAVKRERSSHLSAKLPIALAPRPSIKRRLWDTTTTKRLKSTEEKLKSAKSARVSARLVAKRVENLSHS